MGEFVLGVVLAVIDLLVRGVLVVLIAAGPIVGVVLALLLIALVIEVAGLVLRAAGLLG